MKQMKGLDIQVALEKCEKAHKGRKCVELKELNYPYDKDIKGVGYSCNMELTEPEWT